MILVTGGLGYIGSHLIVDLLNDGYKVVILDNLSRSNISILDHITVLTGKSPVFYQGCISDVTLLKTIIDNYPITHLIHLAGFKSVKESEKYPALYFDNNVNKSIALIEFLVNAGLKNIIFSSTATVYAPSDEPLTEDSPLGPISTYGSTKLFVEQVLENLSHQNPELSVTILRYFNPFGQHPSGLLLDNGADNIYPNIKKALDTNSTFYIYGDDYPTPDGTCVRDYIQIKDLTKYHKLFLNNVKSGYEIYNIGTGIGTSVLDIVSTFSTLVYEIIHRRLGDAPISVCSVSKIRDKEIQNGISSNL
jgi:UDP-glucose 4-epimerase